MTTPTKIPVKGYMDIDGNQFSATYLPLNYIVSQYTDMNNNIITIPNSTSTTNYNFCVGVPVFINQQTFYNKYNPSIPLLIFDNITTSNVAGYMTALPQYIECLEYLKKDMTVVTHTDPTNSNARLNVQLFDGTWIYHYTRLDGSIEYNGKAFPPTAFQFFIPPTPAPVIFPVLTSLISKTPAPVGSTSTTPPTGSTTNPDQHNLIVNTGVYTDNMAQPPTSATSSNTYLMIGAVVLGGLFLMKK